MARKMASVRIIDAIKPIEGADRIETAFIGGWPVVIGKNDGFTAGDKVVYFEPDSMLPLDNPKFAVLADSGKNKPNDKGEMCVVLRTVKLRKQISQGLVMSLNSMGIDDDTPEDTDVSEQLGIQKYDPPEVIGRPANLKNWPNFLHKTDEERIQNLIKMVQWFTTNPNGEELAAKYHASEKLDGTSTTFYRVKDDNQPDGVRYGVCSRSNEVKRTNPDGTDIGENIYWMNYDAYNIKQRLDDIASKHPDAISIAIQGESTGPNINGNRLNRSKLEFHAFNVLIDGERHDPMDEGLADIAVPQLDYKLPFHHGDNPLDDLNAALAIADGIHSKLDNSKLAEGIVWRYDGPIPDGFDNRWIHFKTISNKYLVKLGKE